MGEISINNIRDNQLIRIGSSSGMQGAAVTAGSKSLAQLAIEAFNISQHDNVKLTELGNAIFSSLTAKYGAANMDEFLENTTSRVSATERERYGGKVRKMREDLRPPINISTETKYAIFAYGYLKLLKYQKDNDAVSSAISSQATAYQTTITDADARRSINNYSYETLLNRAQAMLNSNDTNLENVIKVLLFAIHGSSYALKDEVKNIPGISTIYDAQDMNNYAGKKDDMRAQDMLDQIVLFMITAGDNARLPYTTGYGVVAAPGQLIPSSTATIKDVYKNGDVASNTTNWINSGVNNSDPAAAQKAWDLYGQAEKALSDIKTGGVNLTNDENLKNEIATKKKKIADGAAGFFNEFKLDQAGRLENNLDSLSPADIAAARRAMQNAGFNPYRNFFNNHYSLNEALRGSLSRLERALSLPAANTNQNIVARWDAILGKLEERLAADAERAARAAEAAEAQRRQNISDLTAAQRAETEAQGILSSILPAGDNARVRVDEALKTINEAIGSPPRENSNPNETQLNNIFEKTRAAAEALNIPVNNILNRERNAVTPAAKTKVLAEAILAEAKSRETDAAAAAQRAQAEKDAFIGLLSQAQRAEETARDILRGAPVNNATHANAVNDAAAAAGQAINNYSPENITAALNAAKSAAAAIGLVPDNILRNQRPAPANDAARTKVIADEILKKANEIKTQTEIAQAQAREAEDKRDDTRKNRTAVEEAVRGKNPAAAQAQVTAAGTNATAAEKAATEARAAADIARVPAAQQAAEQARRAAEEARRLADEAAAIRDTGAQAQTAEARKTEAQRAFDETQKIQSENKSAQDAQAQAAIAERAATAAEQAAAAAEEAARKSGDSQAANEAARQARADATEARRLANETKRIADNLTTAERAAAEAARKAKEAIDGAGTESKDGAGVANENFGL